jgi:hypothetical protein
MPPPAPPPRSCGLSSSVGSMDSGAGLGSVEVVGGDAGAGADGPVATGIVAVLVIELAAPPAHVTASTSTLRVVGSPEASQRRIPRAVQRGGDSVAPVSIPGGC